MSVKQKIEEKVFASKCGQHRFRMAYVNTPAVEILEEEELPTLNDTSERELARHFKAISDSALNKGGVALIFGTYDNLHVGHRTMLNTASSLCDTLYIGIESQEHALERKKNKHPIMDDADRLKMLKGFNVTTEDKIFVRQNALQDIKRLEQEGIEITTLAVGESQNDNPEVVEAVKYCLEKGIQVVAITRVNVSNSLRVISSSTLHKEGKAKISSSQEQGKGGPKPACD